MDGTADGAGNLEQRQTDMHRRVKDIYNILFVDLLIFLLVVLGGVCGENSCNVFILLFMVLWVPISALQEGSADGVSCLLFPRA
jgi:hypothetical protein